MRQLAGLGALAAAALILGSGASGKSTPAVARAARVATGGLHTCALTSRGGVTCWGWNEHGELGDGTTVDQAAPVPVPGLAGGVRAIAAGGSDETYEGSHTCALTRAGGVECWGWNRYGELGDGTRIDRHTPVPVLGLARGVIAVAAGGESIYRGGFSCALTAHGAVKCWGANQSGQLGDGSRHLRTKPVPVHGLRAKAIAAGGSYACAVTRARRVMCWGDNEYGQLGDGTTRTRTTPVAVKGIGHGVLTVAAEGQSTCVLTTARGVKCWGYNSEGELGDGTTTDRKQPVDIAGLSRGVREIAAGEDHACALTGGGALRCWGFNPWGQLGIGTTAQRHRPTPVRGLARGASAVAAGANTTCAVVRAGALRCWGYNKFGQVGDGTKTTRFQPAGVIGFGSVPCVVPDVRRLTLRDATRAIRAGKCRPGLIQEAASATVPSGLVISQSPKPGARLERGGDVHLVVSTGSAPPPGINLVPPRGWVVTGLSADGRRVAVHVVHRSCHRILIWRGTAAPATVNAGCTTENDRSVTSFALAGQRVAWVDYEYGNHAYCSLLTATASRPHAVDTGFCSGEGGTFVGHLAGSGGLLVFNAWGAGAGLFRLSGTRTRKVLAGPGKATSVDAGRIAVREPSRAVAVYRTPRKFLRRFPVRAKTALLDGSTLVVQKGSTLRPYSLSSGRAGKTLRMLGAHARLEGVADGIAVYVIGPSLHLLRLSDGKDVPLRVTQTERALAQVEPSGLFYASHTKVTFMPMRAVRALFR